MTQQYLSVTEVSKMLHKTRQWIWVLIISGRLDAEKVGRRYIISMDSIIKYSNNKNGANNEWKFTTLNRKNNSKIFS